MIATRVQRRPPAVGVSVHSRADHVRGDARFVRIPEEYP